MRPVIIVVLVIGILGGGGYFAWQRDLIPIPDSIGQRTTQWIGKISAQVKSQVKKLTGRFAGKESDSAGTLPGPESGPEKQPVNAEAERLRTELAAARAQIADRLKSEDVAAIEARAQEIKEEIAGLEAEVASGLKETTDLAASKLEFDAALEDLRKSRDDAASELEEIRIEQEAIRDDIDSRRKQSLQVIRRFERVITEIKARIAENEKLAAEGDALRSEKETLAGEVEVLHNSIEARKQALLGLAGRLLEAIERTGKERQNTLAALEGMEEFRQSHIERLGILRKEYIKIAARNVGIKRDRYKDIAADVNNDAKDFEENTLDQPEAVSALDEIADLVKKLQDDVAGVDRAPGTDSPDAEPGADPDQELPPPDKDQGNDPDRELPPPDADPDQELEASDTDPDHGFRPAKSGGK